MAEKEIVYVRGENGDVIPHDLPLPWGIQDRVNKGQLSLVDPPVEGAPAAEETPVEEAVAESPAEAEAAAETDEQQAEAPKKTARTKA